MPFSGPSAASLIAALTAAGSVGCEGLKIWRGSHAIFVPQNMPHNLLFYIEQVVYPLEDTKCLTC